MKKIAMIAIAVMAAAPAVAAFKASGSQLHPSGRLTVKAPIDFQGNQASYGTFAGIFEFDVQEGALPNGSTSYSAFCIDLSEYTSGAQQYDVVDVALVPQPEDLPWQPMGADRADRLSELFGRYYDSLFDGLFDSIERRAFQLAVWEIVYEGTPTGDSLALPEYGDYNVRNGSFQLNGGGYLGYFANLFVNELDGSGPRAQLWGLHSEGDDHDFVTVPPIVPAPAAVMLGAFGIGIAAWLKRRLS